MKNSFKAALLGILIGVASIATTVPSSAVASGLGQGDVKIIES